MKITMETIAEIPDSEADQYFKQLVEEVGIPKQVIDALKKNGFSQWSTYRKYPKPNEITTKYWINKP